MKPLLSETLNMEHVRCNRSDLEDQIDLNLKKEEKE